MVFRAVIEALPPGWQYPDACEAKIEYGDATFSSERYVETPWSQSAGMPMGAITTSLPMA